MPDIFLPPSERAAAGVSAPDIDMMIYNILVEDTGALQQKEAKGQIQERARECRLMLERLGDFVGVMADVREAAPAPEQSVLLVRNLLFNLKKRLEFYLPKEEARHYIAPLAPLRCT